MDRGPRGCGFPILVRCLSGGNGGSPDRAYFANRSRFGNLRGGTSIPREMRRTHARTIGGPGRVGLYITRSGCRAAGDGRIEGGDEKARLDGRAVEGRGVDSDGAAAEG